MASSTQQLLERIEAFLKAHDMRASQFGRQIANDTSLVYRLRHGKTVRLETADKIIEFMNGYKPAAPKGRRRRSEVAA